MFIEIYDTLINTDNVCSVDYNEREQQVKITYRTGAAATQHYLAYGPQEGWKGVTKEMWGDIKAKFLACNR